MRTILSFFVVLFFVAGCGGSESEVMRMVPNGENGGEDGGSVCERDEVGAPWRPSPDEFYVEDWLHCLGFRLDDRTTWGIPEVAEACQEYDNITGNRVIHDTSRYICHEIMGEEEPFVLPYYEAGQVWSRCRAKSYEIDVYFSQLNFVGFPENPIVHLAEGTTEAQRQHVYMATGYINSSLYPSQQVIISRERVPALEGEPPAGTIYVDFTYRENWVETEDYKDDKNIRAVAIPYDQSSHIWVHPSFIPNRYSSVCADGFCSEATALLAHELLHAIGFRSHISSIRSIMNSNAPPNNHGNHSLYGLLWPVDRAVIEILRDGDYTNGQFPNEQEIIDWLRSWNCS